MQVGDDRKKVGLIALGKYLLWIGSSHKIPHCIILELHISSTFLSNGIVYDDSLLLLF